jgi:hypothetical protein
MSIISGGILIIALFATTIYQERIIDKERKEREHIWEQY